MAHASKFLALPVLAGLIGWCPAAPPPAEAVACMAPRPYDPTNPDPVEIAFTPVFVEGVGVQLGSVTCSSRINPLGHGTAGARYSRSIMIQGSAWDEQGGRAFRLIGPARLLSLTDAAGRDLAELGMVRPAGSRPGVPAQWIWPNGRRPSQQFSVTVDGMSRLPREIAHVAVEVDLEVVTRMHEWTGSLEPSATWHKPMPGIEFRVTKFDLRDEQLTLGYEYRLPGLDEDRAILARIEVLDANGAVVQTHDNPPNLWTRDATIGEMPNWRVNVRGHELGSIRLRVVTETERRTITLEERNLDVLGW
ncbi:MAG: hypothetical protein DHS20C14_12370 [Phycisphaeraceae bacterium]|nr:MAG: hypothetical protein DHS20C14_12370 [Phycisphaeraceae bacterium]